ncbi:HAD family hydrolase [Paenibacillus sp. GCM10023250]|uniref:HAD family hydrolase n=1 Tax=Paenibacillus sp. GCM10023250 TaxID=3252648 RepID=UPI00361BA6C6
MRKQLVLDAGGVIVTNLPGFWTMLADAARVQYSDIRAAYKAELGDGLWTGAVAEADFWRWVEDRCPGVTERDARELLRRNLRPLPAFDRVAAWSRLADVHLLSNHRTEWLAPVVARLRPYLGHVVISSETGASKPADAMFAALRDRLMPAAPVLYVDDHPDNLAAADRFGWTGLLADEDGRWIGEADAWLRQDDRA